MPPYRLRPSQRQTFRVLAEPPAPPPRRGRPGLAFVVAVLFLGVVLGAAAALLLHREFGHALAQDL